VLSEQLCEMDAAHTGQLVGLRPPREPVGEEDRLG
jgi:hypothetical protein